MLHPNPTLTLIKATLWHDMAEYHVGDTPAPVLWKDPEFNRYYVAKEHAYLRDVVGINMDHLSNEEYWWVVGVDKLDCYLWAREQLRLGNQGARRTLENLERWFKESNAKLPLRVMSLYRELARHGWEKDLEEVLNDGA